MYVRNGSEYIPAAVSISCIVTEKNNVKISHSITNLLKEFPANTLDVNHIPDFQQLSQKQINFEIYSLTKTSLD